MALIGNDKVKPVMTRRQFQVLARTVALIHRDLRVHLGETYTLGEYAGAASVTDFATEIVTTRLADMCKASNPNFNPIKFREAVAEEGDLT